MPTKEQIRLLTRMAVEMEKAEEPDSESKQSEPCDESHAHISPGKATREAGKMQCWGCQRIVPIYSYGHKRYGRSWALSNHCKDGKIIK